VCARALLTVMCALAASAARRYQGTSEAPALLTAAVLMVTAICKEGFEPRACHPWTLPDMLYCLVVSSRGEKASGGSETL
jgi:hypothetical protein